MKKITIILVLFLCINVGFTALTENYKFSHIPSMNEASEPNISINRPKTVNNSCRSPHFQEKQKKCALPLKNYNESPSLLAVSQNTNDTRNLTNETAATETISENSTHVWYINITYDTIFYRISSSINLSVNIKNPEDKEASIETNNYISDSLFYYEGRIDITIKGVWKLIIQATSNGSYTIYGYVPNSGYSINNPIILQQGSNITKYTFSSVETHFYSITLEKNQRAFIYIKEVTPLLLKNALVLVATKDRLANPFLTAQEGLSVEAGRINLTFVAFESNIYVIKVLLERNKLKNGTYQISSSYNAIGYSFATAINLKVNQSNLDEIRVVDQFIELKYYLFSLPVEPSWNITIQIREIDLDVMEGAAFSVYDSGKNIPLIQVQESQMPIDGILTATFEVDKGGTFYLVLQPGRFTTGFYEIEITAYKIPIPISGTENENIIRMMSLIFILITFFLAYLLYKKGDFILGKKTWEVKYNQKFLFKELIKSPLFKQNQVLSDDSILVKSASHVYGQSILIRLKSIGDTETLITVSRASSYFDVILYLFILWGVYLVYNYIIDLLFGVTIFFITPPEKYLFFFWGAIIELILGILTVFTVGIPLMNYYYVERNIDLFLGFIEEIQPRYKKFSDNERQKINRIREQLEKKIAYIRVLWNQAKKAFNRKDYTLFMIKADTCLKHLVEVRYSQLSQDTTSREFNEILEYLRAQGFDIPSRSKIEYYRKLRNKLIHSSVVLSEEEANNSFKYFSTFLSRLGLRT